jgi:hypothetical protein
MCPPRNRRDEYLEVLNGYVYELHDGHAVLSTGRLTLDDPPEPGRTILVPPAASSASVSAWARTSASQDAGLWSRRKCARSSRSGESSGE